jgi:hypothetical protein
MSLEEINNTSHEYGPLHPEQLSNSDMEVHPSSQDYEDNDKDTVQPVLIFKRAVCKNCTIFYVIKQTMQLFFKISFPKDSCIK